MSIRHQVRRTASGEASGEASAAPCAVEISAGEFGEMLERLGVGPRGFSEMTGLSRNTVKRYLAVGAPRLVRLAVWALEHGG